MGSKNPAMSQDILNGVEGGGAERGSRRKKIAGYLRAANELRQSYQQSYRDRAENDESLADDDTGIPGAFPDVEIARNGDEEMVLFPSYARRHTKRVQPLPSGPPGLSQDLQDDNGPGDAEYWRRQWEKHEDDTAVVDVDVRGWLYSPHRGPMTRKNRLLMGIARHLSGLPAPTPNSQNGSRASSAHRDRAAEHEAEMVEREANSISQRGRREADVAWCGGYSEATDGDGDQPHIYNDHGYSRSSSPGAGAPRSGDSPHSRSNSSLQLDQDAAPGPGLLSKRESWNQPADMSPAELGIANAFLAARLKPFLTNPLADTRLTIFFYNENTSQSRSTVTNEAGHFNYRAALDFVPTNIRVLATPNLSASEEVRVTEPKGVSMISDIDDTIKHSSIGSGAKEIFRNTFIRDLGDLTIDGVREWYTQMFEKGVQMHYVSNSPWQLYPVLVSFFTKAGLPRGSFHLKQYSGMMQGIFEPVAERKKGTLDKIMNDFPERRFILVGDSGEADLELYTDIAMANPGRILGVFIRDVTTSPSQGFFDSSMGPLSGKKKRSLSSLRGRSERSTSSSLIMTSRERSPQGPKLPPRPSLSTIQSETKGTTPVMCDLIDLDDEPDVKIHQRSVTDMELLGGDLKSSTNSTNSPSPRRPSKPLALRSLTGGNAEQVSIPTPIANRKGPPLPPKPREYSGSQDRIHQAQPFPHPQTENISSLPDGANSQDRQGYRSAVKSKVTSAYNALPSPVSYWNGTSQPSPPGTVQRKPEPNLNNTTSTQRTSRQPPPPPPPRRNISSYPAAAAQYASNRLGYGSSESAGVEGVNGNLISPLNKKEELWKRRWARAKEILDDKGVMLRSWRRGEDAMDDALRLVERAKREGESGPLPRWRSRP